MGEETPLKNETLRGVALLGLIAVGAVVAACTSKAETSPLTDTPPEGLEWGEGGPSFLTDIREVEAYTGDNDSVLEAQERLPTGSALHSEVILRSCGPLGGVCHNRKEYPDLRTPANFLAVINAPCNIQSGTPEGVFDRCERVGDRIDWGRNSYEIGWLEVIPGDPPEGGEENAEMPGLHIHLKEGVSGDNGPRNWATANFSRRFTLDGEVESIGYATYSDRWFIFDEGRHLVARVPGYQVDNVNQLLAVGVEQGDLNRNGVFGATEYEGGPVKMLDPGSPETSYLIARLRGHMENEDVPGTRMPLANPPLSVAEFISLFCFVEGLPESGEVNLASEVDYKNCSYSDPSTHDALAVEGAGQGWSDRIAPLLDSNCGGCHSAERAEGDLVLVGDDVYDDLLDNSSPTDPMGRPFVAPGDPMGSYFYLKLIGDPSIEGKGMPIDPLEGVRTLADDELGDIEAWITDGAAP